MTTDSNMKSIVEKRWVLGLLGLALAFRIGFVLWQPTGFFFWDSVDYDRAAHSFLETGHFDRHYDRPPLYPLLMAGVYYLFGSGQTPLRLLQAVLTTGICVCVWMLGRRLFGARAGLLALAGAALFPLHIVLSGIEYPIAAGTLLIWMALAVFLNTEREKVRSTWAMAGAGVLAGLAVMFFEGGTVALLLLVLWSLLEQHSWSNRVRTVSILCFAAFLTVSPWLLSMQKEGDFRPLFLRAGVHLPYPDTDYPPNAVGNGENLLHHKLSRIVKRPGRFAGHVMREFLHFWSPYPDRLMSADPDFRKMAHQADGRMLERNFLVGTWARKLYAVGFLVLLTTAFIGAIVALNRVPKSLFLIGWPVVLGLCYAVFFTQLRYRIPADPAFILLGAYAVDLTWQRSLGTEIWASLKCLWAGWKRIAFKIAVVQTFILLFLLFVVVVGPTSLLMKMLRKNPLREETLSGSFWTIRERTHERMEECLRQF